ncbi:MAG TPA: alpha/beta hydrolase [Ktedonobacterales bacterium]|nr:alpha/beta hydrolase [Ktedonobacterales bacterium]
MPDITANGLRFFVVDEGEKAAAPVVLLHGFPDTSYVWRHQLPALVGAGYRAIAPDLRGRGRSERTPRVEDYALSNIVADVAGIMDALGVERAHVVGHDWGAAVAWLFASLLPQRVDRLVVLSVGHPASRSHPTLEDLQKGWYRLLIQFPGSEEIFQQDDWYLMRTLLQGGGDVDRYLEDLAEPGALTAGLNWYRANMSPQRLVGPPPQLPPVQAPTLGIFSTGDLYLTEDAMLRSAEHVAGPWRYERIEGVSHWIPVEAPEQLNRLLLEFLPPQK